MFVIVSLVVFLVGFVGVNQIRGSLICQEVALPGREGKYSFGVHIPNTSGCWVGPDLKSGMCPRNAIYRQGPLPPEEVLLDV